MWACKRNKFWLENPINLVCNLDVIPLNDMEIAQQMNALTRLVLIVFIILTLLSFKYNLLFLLISLLIIIILYYLQKNQMERLTKENFKHSAQQPNYHALPKPEKLGKFITNTRASYFWCDDEVPLDGPNGAFNNPDYISINQKLAGEPNPKTRIAPVVTPPAADLSYWRANNLVTHSAVNKQSQIDVAQSGYQVITCCPPDTNSWQLGPVKNELTYEKPLQQQPYIKPGNTIEKFSESFDSKPETALPNSTNTVEEYSYPYLKTAPDVPNPEVYPNQPGWVNTACGYNPDQLFNASLPTNLPAGNCEQDPAMKQYNKNLFTQTIQPGTYSFNEINEPINSNIGISFQQQFPPTTVKMDQTTGDTTFTEHDPRIMEPALVEPNLGVLTEANEANIYDPRFSGYGTSYRSYTDDVTGQTRFFYDDVDAIRMPNYIVRSKIDNQPFADHYGPLPAGNSNGNEFNAYIRGLANNAFLDGTIQLRTELQERLMRKVNANQWQQRQAPINTQGQRMLGGLSSCK